MTTQTHFGCGQPILLITTGQKTVPADPEPDADGTLEVRRSGGGLYGRYTGKGTPAAPGYVKHRVHVCAESGEAS